LAIGDDAAILNTDSKQQLVVSTDTLVAGVHFKSTDSPKSIGHKSLAVSFSDMAAMGAEPKWVLLNLTLTELDKKWCDAFINGFSQLLIKHQAQLIGGDTTQGPISITVTVMGETKQAITRKCAQVNNLIVISGELGSAAFALNNPKKSKTCDTQLHTPEPRLDVAKQIKHIATSMIDVSDGLAAVVELSQIPVIEQIKKDPDWMQYVLAGGDDYQLCFTIHIDDEDQLPDGCCVIGQILEAGEDIGDVTVLNQHQPIQTDHLKNKGYQHFNHD